MARKKINWILVVASIGVFSAWAIWALGNNAGKSQKMEKVAADRGGQFAQTGDSSNIKQGYTEKGDVNFYEHPTIVQPDAEKVRELENKIKDLTSYRGEFPNRPKLIVPAPKIDLVFYTGPAGLCKGRFEILFLNIGGVEAKNVKTKWTIYDHDNKITGLQEWLALIGQPPMVIDNIPSGVAKGLTYIPDMTCYAEGKIKLTIDYTYTDANTGKEYSDQYNGFALYEKPRDNKVREFIFSKAVE